MSTQKQTPPTIKRSVYIGFGGPFSGRYEVVQVDIPAGTPEDQERDVVEQRAAGTLVDAKHEFLTSAGSKTLVEFIAAREGTNEDEPDDSVAAVEAKRSTVAEYQFSQWEFPFSVKDVDGWETAGCVWNRTVFLEVPDQEKSVKVIFQIVFEIGTAGVTKIEATFTEGQVAGHPT